MLHGMIDRIVVFDGPHPVRSSPYSNCRGGVVACVCLVSVAPGDLMHCH